MLVGLAIGLFIGLVMGIVIVALMAQGNTSDLCDEINRLNNLLYFRDAKDYEDALRQAEMEEEREDEEDIGMTD